MSEKRFTSTRAKILHNTSLMESLRRGRYIPQSIQLAPTNICNLNCNMCSVKDRGPGELTLTQVKNLLVDFAWLGAKTVELTGGGDPTMFPMINETIAGAVSLGYAVGMITNGVALREKVTQDNLDKLAWLRISLNSLDYVREIDVPKIKGTLGFSYVWTNISTEERLQQIASYAQAHKALYVRIVPNCLDASEKETLHLAVEPFIEKFPGMFLQEKSTGVPPRCWIGYIKPFVNADGWVYRCSANPLLLRKFHPAFRMCAVENILNYWQQPATAFSTELCESGKCFFSEQNALIEDITARCEHPLFI